MKWLAPIAIGALAGIATLYIVPAKSEIFVWLALVIVTALASLPFPSRRKFLFSMIFGVVSGMTVTLVHLMLFGRYVETHGEETAAMAEFFHFKSPILPVLIMAPIYWLILGAFTGLLAQAIRKLGLGR